jgi:hypothetical protein
MITTLLPCPFCGSTNLVEEVTAAVEIEGYIYIYQDCWIECVDCGAKGPIICVTDDTETDIGDCVFDYQVVRDRWNVCIDRKKI